MTTPVIAIIGAGNMGSSLIGGLINDGHPGNKLWATDPSEEKLAHLQQTFPGIHTTTDNTRAVQAADVVIFAVKPQIFATVATDLAHAIQWLDRPRGINPRGRPKGRAALLPLGNPIAKVPRQAAGNKFQARKPLVISIAAGIREASIQHWLGGNSAIVRAMPNTPALISCGATALYANKLVTQAQHETAESILRAVGVVVWLPNEQLMDTVTALSGSGPAYFFLMMEALQHAAEELGMPNETARLLTLQTALGAARMAIESGTPLAELRRNVTSPSGTTEKAISVLEDNDIRGLFRKALRAAKLRSEELAKLLGEKK